MKHTQKNNKCALAFDLSHCAIPLLRVFTSCCKARNVSAPRRARLYSLKATRVRASKQVRTLSVRRSRTRERRERAGWRMVPKQDGARDCLEPQSSLHTPSRWSRDGFIRMRAARVCGVNPTRESCSAVQLVSSWCAQAKQSERLRRKYAFTCENSRRRQPVRTTNAASMPSASWRLVEQSAAACCCTYIGGDGCWCARGGFWRIRGSLGGHALSPSALLLLSASPTDTDTGAPKRHRDCRKNAKKFCPNRKKTGKEVLSQPSKLGKGASLEPIMARFTEFTRFDWLRGMDTFI